MRSLFKSKKFLITTAISSLSLLSLSIGLGVGLNNTNSIQNSSLAEEATIVDPSVLLHETIQKINENSVVFKPLSVDSNRSIQKKKGMEANVSVDKSSTYAFEIKPEQIKLKQGIEIDKDLNLEFLINYSLNKARDLNQGNLIVQAKLTHKKSEKTETKSLMFNGFKKVVLNNSNGIFKQGSTTEIVLSPSKKGIEDSYLPPFNTIEQLNNYHDGVLGLALWMRMTAEESEKSKWNDFNLEGQVKLKRITKENEQNVFYLTSADENIPLWAIIKENGKEIKIPIEEIKTTNIMPTDLTVVPKGYDENETKSLLRTLENIQVNNAYLKDEKDEALGWNLSVNLNHQADTHFAQEMKFFKNKAFIKPFSIKKPESSNKIKLDYRLSYGRGQNAKTYDSSNPDDEAELKVLGINFDFFTKKATDTKPLGRNEIFKEASSFYTKLFEESNKGAYVKYIEQVLNNKMPPQPVPNVHLGNNELFVKDSHWKGLSEITYKMPEIKNETGTYLIVGTFSYSGFGSTKEALVTPVISIIEVK